MRKIFLVVLLALLVVPVSAHDATLAFTSINFTEPSIRVNFTTPDSNVKAVQNVTDSFPDYFGERFAITNNGQPCAPEFDGRHALGNTSASYIFTYACSQPLAELGFTYDLFFDIFPAHENVVTVFNQTWTGQTVLSSVDNRRLLSVGERAEEDGASEDDGAAEPADDAAVAFVEKSTLGTISQFFVLGVEHILIGFDHILFLIGLLLVAMHAKYLVKIVTSFTIAHSITLIAATLGILAFDPRLTEAVIALSITYVAFENLYIKFVHSRADGASKRGWRDYFANPKKRWVITFIFGLIHGFGFSGVLREIGLPQNDLIPALLSFNVGVEAGQLAIVAIVFPYIWMSRHHKWHDRGVKWISVAIGIMGILWFMERVFLV